MPRAKGRDMWRLKEWYDIIAPSMFGNMKVGKTMATDQEQVKNRILKASLADLTDDFSKSHINVLFEVNEVKDGQALTKFIGHEISREYLRSQVRRRATKVDCITDITTKDNRKLRMTSMVISLRRIQKAQVRSIRSKMSEVIRKRAQELEFGPLVQELVLGKLASDVYNEVKKICSVRRVEVQKSKVID